jgi:hypothetical protein
MRIHRVAAATGVVAAVVAVDATHLAAAMSLDFSWAGVVGCTSKPPAFTVSDVPESTSRLAFNMVDLNLPSFPHGGGTIDYHGGDQLAAGSFTYHALARPKVSATIIGGRSKPLMPRERRSPQRAPQSSFRRDDSVGGPASKMARPACASAMQLYLVAR